MLRRGATQVEYALMLMLVGLSCILVVSMLGTNVGGLYDGLALPDSSVPADRSDEPSPPDEKGKGNHGKGRHGNPGGGNNGNDKGVGNAH